ncbi:MAG: hypothetical protein QF491_19510, partial [Alphaproteobacteria bacterium]|nr:hypothetical protein [Alphaproteobacteria bacterium]
MSLSRLIGRGVIAGLAAGSLLLAAQTAQALPVTSGLVAYWSGDDNADDGSGNGHHGSLVGGAGYGAGQFGQAFEFTGGGQSVTVPDSNDFHFAGNFTVNLWAQIHDGPSGSVGGPGWAGRGIGLEVH